MAERLSTGVDYLDQQLGGGLAPGRLVALRTAPGSQGELLLKEVATTHGGVYLSTTRSQEAVKDWLWPASTIEVRYVGVDATPARGGDAIRDWVEAAGGWAVPEDGDEDGRGAQVQTVVDAVRQASGVVVIDPVNPLERAVESRYLGLLQALHERVRRTESIGLLHLVDAAETPPGRWLTLQVADEVWDVDVEVKNAEVDFLLTVSKSRSDDVPNRQIKLHLGHGVDVDTSRDIA